MFFCLVFVVPLCNLLICALNQVWYLIVSNPDLCTLTYFLVYLTGNLPHPVKIVIAGNHDLTFDYNLVHNRRDYLRRNFRVHEAQLEDVLNEYGVTSVKELLTNCVYLEDETVDVCGIKVYGSPWYV